MSTTDVLLVGAGPVGMTMALELSVQGVSFRVVDKAPARSDKSRAVGVQSRTLEILNRYGDSVQELLGKSNRLGGNAVWVNGKRFDGFNSSIRSAAASEDRDTQFPGMYFISQVDTEGFLAGRLDERGVTVERPVAVKSIVQDDGGATTVLVRGDGSEETVRSKYVVGCDGAHSAVRHAMDVQFEGDAYPQDFILADTYLDWSDDTDNKAHLFVGEGLFLMLPLQAGRTRILASRPTRVASDEDLTLQVFQDMFDAVLPPEYPGPRPRLHDPVWLSHFRIHHRCVTRYRDGRLFVAGDAAHLHSPVGGQGMNTGMQDAVNLGWKLARVLRGEQPDAFLDTYHEERRPVGQHLVTQTDQLFTFISSNDPGFKAMRNVLLPHALPSMADTGLQLLRFFSELGVKYRRSSVVHTADGFEGPVRGGFRAPDGRIRTADGRDDSLLNLLRGSVYHLLLFSATADQKDVEEAERQFVGLNRGVQVHTIVDEAPGPKGVVDLSKGLHKRYGFESRPGYVLVRPDGYVENIGYLDSFDDLLKGTKGSTA